jgi:translation initiation factor IF-3
LQIAQEHGLDLVEVSPTATPPVCRLLDYGKYKYEQSKKERKQRRSQKVGLLKEVRLRPKIEEHDLQAKIRTTRKLLEEGNKIRLVVRFRGREVVYPELGWRVLKKVTDALKEVAVVSDHPTQEERNIAVTLSPVPTKKSKEARISAEAQDS